MKQSLKQQMKRHFREIELDQRQMTELDSLMQAQAEEKGRNSRSYGGRLAIAGLFLVAAVTLFMLSQLPVGVSQDMPRLIAEEVVKNHLKLKPLDVKAGTISALRGYFTKLEFMPVESGIVSAEGLRLIGGRYCSLQGITAAQLRMKQGNNLQTLYQTQYLPGVFGPLPKIDKGEAPLIVYARGIKVKIWVEKGLLFALTEAPDVKTNRE